MADDADMVELELGNVITPGSLRLPVEPLALALVVPTFIADKMLTMVGFLSSPRETPNNDATPEVLEGLL